MECIGTFTPERGCFVQIFFFSLIYIYTYIFIYIYIYILKLMMNLTKVRYKDKLWVLS